MSPALAAAPETSRLREPAAELPGISVVLETESARDASRLGLQQSLAALARQDYPRECLEVIVVDGGAFPDLAAVVGAVLPGARIVDGRGLSKFQMKNLGAAAATRDIVALMDSDCVMAPQWLAAAARALAAAPPGVAGVQGRTRLARGAFSRQVNALTHGLRSRGTGTTAPRILADNCAFRRHVLCQLPFPHAELSTVPETAFMRRLTGMGRRVVMNEEMAVTHDYPGVGFLLSRGYGTGLCMMRMRRTDRTLRAWWAGRLGPLGPPILTAGKLVTDWRQLALEGTAQGLGWRDWLAFAPLYAGYYAAHLAGGYAALCGLPTPRF